MASRVDVLIRSLGQRRECLYQEVGGEGEGGRAGMEKKTSHDLSLLDDEEEQRRGEGRRWKQDGAPGRRREAATRQTCVFLPATHLESEGDKVSRATFISGNILHLCL